MIDPLINNILKQKNHEYCTFMVLASVVLVLSHGTTALCYT